MGVPSSGTFLARRSCLMLLPDLMGKIKAGSGTIRTGFDVRSCAVIFAFGSLTEICFIQAKASFAKMRLIVFLRGPTPKEYPMIVLQKNRTNNKRRAQYGILTRLSSSWKRPPPPHKIRSDSLAALIKEGNP
jgi:hypothetical protein